MRLLSILVGLVTLALPAIAAAQESMLTLSIRRDEVVVARVEGNGFSVVSRGSDRESNSRPPAGTVRLTLVEMPGMGMMLVVENQYDRAFSYRGRMVVRRRSAPTSVCTTLPGLTTVENWPQRIDRFELSEPRLSDTAEAACR